MCAKIGTRQKERERANDKKKNMKKKTVVACPEVRVLYDTNAYYLNGLECKINICRLVLHAQCYRNSFP